MVAKKIKKPEFAVPQTPPPPARQEFKAKVLQEEAQTLAAEAPKRVVAKKVPKPDPHLWVAKHIYPLLSDRSTTDDW